MLAAEAAFEVTFVMVSSASASRLHPRPGIAATGAAIGVVLGALLYSLPLAIVAMIGRAALSARYFREQRERVPVPAEPSKEGLAKGAFGRLLGVELATGLMRVASISFASVPGILMVLLGVEVRSVALIRGGVLLTMLASLALCLYVWPGIAFASRVLVFTGGTPLSAVKASWRFAEGRRRELLGLLIVAYGVEAVGLVGLAIFLVGALLTSPCARVLRDTMLTSIYVRLSSQEAEASRERRARRRSQVRPA